MLGRVVLFHVDVPAIISLGKEEWILQRIIAAMQLINEAQCSISVFQYDVTVLMSVIGHQNGNLLTTLSIEPALMLTAWWFLIDDNISLWLIFKGIFGLVEDLHKLVLIQEVLDLE